MGHDLLYLSGNTTIHHKIFYATDFYFKEGSDLSGNVRCCAVGGHMQSVKYSMVSSFGQTNVNPENG